MVSETAEFYKNKNIFITGGTGFLGIAIIEKLLRTTPEVIAFPEISTLNSTFMHSYGTIFVLQFKNQ